MAASISALSSAAVAADYYGKDNYYAKEDGDRDPSEWSGRGAEKLGLKGEVDIETFKSALEGKLPDGSIVGQRDGEEKETAEKRSHRPGVDLTFSPPKDASLLLLIGGDKRILKAHEQAVHTALKWTERNLAGARVRPPKDGEKEASADRENKTDKGKEADQSPNPAIPVKTGNLVIAKFQHDISRDKDPQLHTHCVIANATQTKDGKWRALHNDPLFEQRKTISLIYDAQMRENLRKMGFQVKLEDGKTGAYSIVGVPKDAVSEFSQRTETINEIASSLENPTPAALKKISLKTRPSKVEMTRDEKHRDWKERAEPWRDQLARVTEAARIVQKEGRQEQLLDEARPEQGLDETLTRWSQNFFRPTKTLRLQRDDPYKLNKGGSEKDYAARAAVSFALRHHEERDASFSLHNVRRTALEHGADGLTIKDIDRELRVLRMNRHVQTVPTDPHAESTTARSISNEERTKFLVTEAGTTRPITNSVMVDHKLKETALTGDQRNAVKLVLSSDKRLVGIQGYAGTGKTTMMKHAASLSTDLAKANSDSNVKILGLAPTHSAVRSLEEGLGYRSQTVQSFMIEQSRGEGPRQLRNTIVVIDEASFLSTKNMNQIVGKLIDLDARKIVLSGDRRQHGSIEAGRPFDLAQRAGMITAIMKDIVRLRPRDDSQAEKSRIENRKAAVTDAGMGRIVHAIKRLSANTHEVPKGLNHDDLQKWMAAKATELGREFDPGRKDGVMFVAQGHRMRALINDAVRSELIESNILGSKETTIETLRANDMTRTEAISARTYKEGDILAFHGRADAVNARPGQRRTVVGVDPERNRITIANRNGREKTIGLEALAGRKDYVPHSINRKESLSLRENDQLLFTRSHREAKIAAHDAATVKAFDDKTVTLEIDGKDRVFKRSDPALQSLTHGYAITSHAGQGKTATHVVTIQDSREKMLASQVGFYTDISRSADNLAVITDDKAKLEGQLIRNSGLNSSALDTEKCIDDLTGLDKDPVMEGGDTGTVENGPAEGAAVGTEKDANDDIDPKELGAEMSL